MEKVCVFCGGKPVSKTKEHVVPKWLIELTGSPDRLCYWGIDLRKRGRPLRKFAAKNLHFPACDECNNESGELESQTKAILQKILENTPVDGKEIDTFLDWIDKIRMGLWLGMRYLDDNFWRVDPAYFIRKRIGVADRMVAIHVCSGKKRLLLFSGIQTPGFNYMPSCFAFSINDFVFFNASTDYLFSRRIGFPYPEEIFMTGEPGHMLYAVEPARKRIMKPIIRRSLYPPVLSLYQPVVRKGVLQRFPEYYEDDYVTERMLIKEKGKGKILVERRNDIEWLSGLLQILDKDYPYEKESRSNILKEVDIQTLDFQRYLNDSHCSLTLLERDERIRTKRLRQVIKQTHDMLIKKRKNL